MTPEESPIKELDDKYVVRVAKFISDLRNGKLEGSNKIALATISLLENIINDQQNATAFELCSVVRSAGRMIAGALPYEPVPTNMVRRVLRAIRDEDRPHASQSGEGGESLQRLVLATAARRGTVGLDQQDLREPIRDHLAELACEVEQSSLAVGSQARGLVHADELILTLGADDTAERFLRAAAAAAPRYRLILVEDDRPRQSQEMALRLSNSGVPVTLVTAAAAAGLMSRVNKVVVGVRAALGGGAVLGTSGLHAVTTAAKHYSVPVLALGGLHTLCPLHACDPHQDALASPTHALPYQSSGGDSCHVYAPMFDLVPPDHITLFITNLGGCSPSYIYRLLSELYDPSDYQL